MSTESEVNGSDASNHIPPIDPRTGLQLDLERLRELLIIAMDDLAEKVLGQIQTTRAMVDVADSLLMQTGQLAPPARPPDMAEARVRRRSNELEAALRELPDWMQEGYVHTCRELARAIRSLPTRADESDLDSGSG